MSDLILKDSKYIHDKILLLISVYSENITKRR